MIGNVLFACDPTEGTKRIFPSVRSELPVEQLRAIPAGLLQRPESEPMPAFPRSLQRRTHTYTCVSKDEQKLLGIKEVLIWRKELPHDSVHPLIQEGLKSHLLAGAIYCQPIFNWQFNCLFMSKVIISLFNIFFYI